MKAINIKVSDKLKGEFQEACLAREMSESNVIRDLMTNFVRANKRQIGKPEDEQPVTASKSASKPAKKIVQKRQKTA